MRYLHHVNVNTMSSQRSYRCDIDDDAVVSMSDIIARAIKAGRSDLVNIAAHCNLTALRMGSALIAVINAPAGPHDKGKPYIGKTIPIVEIFVPRRSRATPKLWAKVFSDFEDEVPQRPQFPWIAVREYVMIARYPDTQEWLEDLERLIGWGWIEFNDMEDRGT